MLMAIDQGTSSSRTIIFSKKGELISSHQLDLTQYYPQEAWVEQDPEEMWKNSLICCQDALKKSHLSAKDIAAIGISNQRETTIMWDRQTGKPIYPAIVWQDRRTASLCKSLMEHPINAHLQQKTGLLLDPYFSATKIMWLLDHIPNARERAQKGELAFGTVDTFLVWHFTKGKSHVTDATNASRTLLFNIHTQQWDTDILNAFHIPKALLPTVLDNSAHFGETASEFLGASIPITGIAGDQQAASIGQACFEKGMIKSTYGTGCFMLLNTGEKPILSHNRLLATIAYRLQNKVSYGLEGSIFSAGVIVKWMRDTLKWINTAAETEKLAESVSDNGGVYLVPGFTGLGAPYWDPDARGAILGLTRNSSIPHIVRAGLEAVCYQTQDLLTAMQNDSQTTIKKLRVDGGMVVNNWLLQFLADILTIPIERPCFFETSAQGVAFLAGLYVGVYSSLDEVSTLWQMESRFNSTMTAVKRDYLYQGWQKSVARVLTN